MTRVKYYFYAIISIVAIWYGLSIMAGPVIPSPYATIVTFIYLLQDDLLIHMAVSLYRIMTSLSLAFCIGVPLGLTLGQEKKFDDFFSIVIMILYPIPKIVFLPVLLMLLGLGDLPRILLISLIIFFHMVVTARDASKNIQQQSMDSIISLGAGKYDIYRHVIVPACMPQIFTSLRISLGTALSVLFFTETFATTRGIGYFIMDAWTRADYNELFSGILAMSVIGLLLFALTDMLEKTICRWKYCETRIC
ncbi:MAG TPA: ABC transporter permease subunit [Thermoanaerobacterales bacterium]|nr:ABC transporter permease subunit [Thermoanaerobacterales bacterium]